LEEVPAGGKEGTEKGGRQVRGLLLRVEVEFVLNGFTLSSSFSVQVYDWKETCSSLGVTELVPPRRQRLVELTPPSLRRVDGFDRNDSYLLLLPTTTISFFGEEMPSSLPSIAPLPHPTVSTLRSSTIITSLPQALTELVQNALDAQARHIVVYLELERWGLRVEDDGTGLRKEAVEAIGSGERYGQSDKGEGRKEEDVELDERSSPFSPPPRPPSSSLNFAGTSKTSTHSSPALQSTFGFRGEGVFALSSSTTSTSPPSSRV